jgi:hypothetical protein
MRILGTFGTKGCEENQFVPLPDDWQALGV